MDASDLRNQAHELRASGQYRAAGERFMSSAYLRFANAWNQELTLFDFGMGLGTTVFAALCANLAGLEAVAKIYSSHGLLVAEQGRKYEFNREQYGMKCGAEARTAVCHEWAGDLRAAATMNSTQQAYETARDQYGDLDEALPATERLGWQGEPEFDYGVIVFERIARASEYPDWEAIRDEMSGPELSKRGKLKREHMPQLVAHVLANGEWSD